jgi:hypothetical protein
MGIFWIMALKFALSAPAWSQVEPLTKEGPIIMVTTSEVALSNGCWAFLYDQNRLQGERILVYSAVEFPNLRFSPRENWSARVNSIEVGPKARLKLYGAENWEEREHVLGPRSKLENMNQIPMALVSSLKMLCLP